MKKILFSFIVLFSFTSLVFAQSNAPSENSQVNTITPKVTPDKVQGNDQVNYFYSTGNGSTNDPSLSSTPVENKVDSRITEISEQIRQARLNNDNTEAMRLQGVLNQLSGSESVVPELQTNLSGMLSNYYQMEGTKIPFNSPDYNVSTINTGAFWAIATATSARSNAVFAAATKYSNGQADTLKVFVSYNGGQSWVLKGQYFAWVASVDYRARELDIEPVISGSDTMLYVVAGYDFNGHALSHIARFNIGTGAVYSSYWNFGGALNTNVNTHNPRITSDNTNYTGAAYVYITIAHDSLRATNNHHFTQRFMVILNPYATTPTFTYRVANAAGTGFWWHSSGVTNGNYLWQDVAYFAAATDRIYTIYHVEPNNGNSMYTAWSNDYGVTNGGALSIAETAANNFHRIEANGGASNQNVAIGYRRLFGGADWDFRVQYSSTGGTTTGSFTASYPEYTSDSTQYIDFQAIDLANGRYKFGYGVTGGRLYYRGNTNPTTYTTAYLYNNTVGNLNFGGIRAGWVRSGLNDSCLAVWSASTGSGVYASYGCQTTVGISNNNEIPSSYSLGQNYPNPFNPSTSIKFSIPVNGLVKLTVFDVLGREVVQLINQEMTTGNYTVDFDASGLTSGIYMYRIDAGSFTETKKMLLIK